MPRTTDKNSKPKIQKTAKTSKKQVAERDEHGRVLPGSTANPNGRPQKEFSITATIQAMMGEKPAIKQKLAKKILAQANKGDLAALKLIWQYMDGMPTQRLEGEMDMNNRTILTDEQLNRILEK